MSLMQCSRSGNPEFQGTADNFPPSLWDKLLPQTEITLNLLRQSNATPTISAYAHINGPFDYNKMPLGPMECEMQVHKKTDKQGTWAYHSIDGWYLNTSPEHYRVHNCYIKSTKSTRLSNTVQFQQQSITNPKLTPANKLMQAIANYKAALQGLKHHSTNQQMQELKKIVKHAQKKINNNTHVPRVHVQQQQQQQPVPRVQATQTNQRHASLQTTQVTHNPVTRTTAQRAKACRLQSTLDDPVNFPQHPLALSTRSRTSKVITPSIPTVVASTTPNPRLSRSNTRTS
ncbi:hypothetical protein ACHAW6_000415 [Cyclotella cf. meneghiniana]